MSVDEFIERKVLPQYRTIVQTFRTLMRELAPEAQEIMYRSVPAYKRKTVLAVISPTKQGITLSFAHGALFDDKYGLLQGEGKTSKVIRVKCLDAEKTEALRYYLKQAIELDER